MNVMENPPKIKKTNWKTALRSFAQCFNLAIFQFVQMKSWSRRRRHDPPSASEPIEKVGKAASFAEAGPRLRSHSHLNKKFPLKKFFIRIYCGALVSLWLLLHPVYERLRFPCILISRRNFLNKHQDFITFLSFSKVIKTLSFQFACKS